MAKLVRRQQFVTFHRVPAETRLRPVCTQVWRLEYVLKIRSQEILWHSFFPDGGDWAVELSLAAVVAGFVFRPGLYAARPLLSLAPANDPPARWLRPVYRAVLRRPLGDSGFSRLQIASRN